VLSYLPLRLLPQTLFKILIFTVVGGSWGELVGAGGSWGEVGGAGGAGGSESTHADLSPPCCGLSLGEVPCHIPKSLASNRHKTASLK
jgi:hypothetical protein